MNFLQKLRRFPVLLAVVATSPTPSTPNLGNVSGVLRFENARVQNNGTCTVMNIPSGGNANITCARTGTGVTKLTFANPWPEIPNCTATPMQFSVPLISANATLTDVTVTTGTYNIVLALLSLNQADGNYAIRCSGLQQ